MSEPEYTLGLWGELKRSVAYTGRLLGPLVKICLVLGILVILFGIVLRPFPSGNGRYSPNNALMQIGRQIGQMLFSYSTDNVQNNNAYPDGNSSTEVFQKLIDGGYVNDPAIFYVPLPGKVKPVAGQKLKRENVCWDVTSGVDSHDPNVLPLVFLTGYKVTYAPSGSAVPIINPYSQFGPEPRTWGEWWNEGCPLDSRGLPSPGIAVFYKGNYATFLHLYYSENEGTITKNPDGTIPNFLPPDFDPKGKTYRQLTPDGPLPGN